MVHAYPKGVGDVVVRVEFDNNDVVISVSDEGVGIKDFQRAREPFYTTKPEEERSGMGFAVMESFMDDVQLQKNGEKGLKVVLRKTLRRGALSKQLC